MLYDDTIAAIATPPGEGGIGIVRLSGAQALPILERIFAPMRPGRWLPFRMRLGRVVDPAGGMLDEALAVYMRAPTSFTAEDVVEVSCHGGPLVVARVLAEVLAQGARLAEPGEFTMRAFLHGRIDLAQAEATLDVIQAKTSVGLALAQAHLGGWLTGQVRRVRELVLGPLAYVTALVDFPEDEIAPQAITEPLEESLVALERLCAGADQGMMYRQGARVALVGRPNTGKSSLLNLLLRVDRAIVTPIPGTTRDTLEETANLSGIPVVLIDTAGIAETEDPVERLGIVRSQAALAGADLALLVLDAHVPLCADDEVIARTMVGKPTIVVLNKCDLVDGFGAAQTNAHIAQELAPLSPVAVVRCSALTGAGIEGVIAAVSDHLLGGGAVSGAQLVSNPRHRDALERATSHLRDALAGHRRGGSPDLVAVDLTAALAVLGEITGETVGEELLTTIFSRFCIGK